MFLFAVCQALSIPYLFIHANFIYEKFQIQSCEIPLETFWQLMTFDIPTNNFRASSRKLFVASFLHRLFDKHALECGGETKSVGFYLLLVIDCKKLISEEGCLDITPHKALSFFPLPLNRTNSIIVNKKIVFRLTSTTCERMMIYET